MKTAVSTSDCNKRDNSEPGSVKKKCNSNIMNLVIQKVSKYR